MTPDGWYRERVAHWNGRRDRDLALATSLSRFRLATFLGGVGLTWWALRSFQGDARTIGVLAGLAALVAFGVLVVRHARVLDDVARAEAALQLNQDGLSRLARDWNSLPEVQPHAAVDMDGHPYARDLDIFGHASIAKWLGAAATADGTRRLHDWLLSAAPPDVVTGRQSATEELAAKREWRETLGVEGRLTSVSAADVDRFLAWAESNDHPVPSVLLAASVALPLTTVVLLTLFMTGATEGAWWLIPVVTAVVLSFAYARTMYETFERATVGQRATDRYATMLGLVCAERWTSALVDRQKQAMCIGGEAPAVLARLARLAGWSELRTGAAIFHFPIQALTLWDFHVYFAFQRWRARYGRHVRGWIAALGAVDALAILARIPADEPDWTMPRVAAAIHEVTASSLGHPLIPGDRRVVNDVEVGPRGTLLLITGSNMSGKSTLLRAIGLNAVLAQAGAPVCASAFTMPPVDLQTSIRVQDSLELGLSYFMAALARLKQIVDAAERGAAPGRVLLYLLDEVLQGTNSVERDLAVRAVVRHLLDAGAIGAMTTHDLGLAGEDPLKAAAVLAHFTEQVHPDGRMTFDYRLRPGLATSTNALRLMQLIGIQPK
jgi:hypothetical protein